MDLSKATLKKFEIRGKPILYALDLSAVPYAVCGLCGNLYHFDKKNITDIRKEVFEHLQHEDKEAFEFDWGGYPHMAELFDCLQPALLTDAAVAGAHNIRRLILPEADPMCTEVIALLESLSFFIEEQNVDILTWSPTKADDCITIRGYSKGLGWIGVATAEQWSVLNNAVMAKVHAETEAQGRRLAAQLIKDIPIMTPASRLSDALNTVPVTPSHFRSVLGSRSLPDETTTAELTRPGSGESVDFMDDLRLRTSPNENIVVQDHCPTKATVTHNELKRKRIETLLSNILLPKDLRSGEITNEAMARSAWLTRDLDILGADQVLVEACLAVLGWGHSRLNIWALVERETLDVIFAKMINATLPLRAEGKNLESVAFNIDLQPALAADYSRHLAMFFRIIVDEKLVNYDSIKAALFNVLHCQAENFIGGDIWRTQQFACLVSILSKTLYNIAKNHQLIVTQVLQHLVIEAATLLHADRAVAHDECHNHMRAARSGMDPYVPSLWAEEGPRIVELLTVTNIMKALEAYLYGFKMSIGLEIDYFGQLLCQPLVGGVITFQRERPFEIVLAECRKVDMTSLRYVAVTIAALNSIDVNSECPSYTNCTPDTAEGGMVRLSTNEESRPLTVSAHPPIGSITEVLLRYDRGQMDAQETMEHLREVLFPEVSKISNEKRIRLDLKRGEATTGL